MDISPEKSFNHVLLERNPGEDLEHAGEITSPTLAWEWDSILLEKLEEVVRVRIVWIGWTETTTL